LTLALNIEVLERLIKYGKEFGCVRVKNNINNYQQLSTIINNYQQLSTIINNYQQLSTIKFIKYLSSVQSIYMYIRFVY